MTIPGHRFPAIRRLSRAAEALEEAELEREAAVAEALKEGCSPAYVAEIAGFSISQVLELASAWAHGAPRLIADDPAAPAPELRRASQLTEWSEELQQRLADLAHKVAETEDRFAEVHEGLADSRTSVAEAASGHARRARDMAEHERQEQRRWSS